MERFYWFRFLAEAAWAPLFVFAIHVIAFILNTYEYLPMFDILMHLLGGVVMAFFFHRALVNASLLGSMGPHHVLIHRLLIFTSTCTVAVFWEFLEFVVDWWFNIQLLAGLNDTMGDLFWGIVGGLAFIILSAFVSRSRALSSGSTVR